MESIISPIVERLERSLDRVVLLTYREGNTVFERDFCPRKIIYLEGVLVVVGEDCHERSIRQVDVSNIISMSESSKEYEENFASIEFEDYINAIRAVSGDTLRLILKIKDVSNLNLSPRFQHLGNPYLTQSSSGDYIWAATLDESDSLYEWLYSIRVHIEIYDPESVRERFFAYCEKRGDKHLKKVS